MSIGGLGIVNENDTLMFQHFLDSMRGKFKGGDGLFDHGSVDIHSSSQSGCSRDIGPEVITHHANCLQV